MPKTRISRRLGTEGALCPTEWLRYAVLAGVALLVLAGCGEGYVLEPARLNFIGMTDESKKQRLLDVVSIFLRKEGFEDFGRYDTMIDLIQHNPAMPSKAKEEELARLNRERTFLNDPRHLRIIWADYSNATPADLAQLHYTPSSIQFVEIEIYEERPGGFGAAGQSFYHRFLADLKDRFGDSIVVVTEPPANNESEYRRITVANVAATILWSALALLIPLVLTGALTRAVLQRLRLPLMAKRVTFVLVNAWLVAPMPFPATIVEVPAPNLLAFPWTDFSFYARVASYAAISFSVTLVVCAVVSVRLFKVHTAGKPGPDGLAASSN
jgi:hypothetical protein